MKQIALTQNQIALVDDDDYEILSKYHWCYRGERDGKQGYAIRHAKQPLGGYKTQYLHRAIFNPSPGHEVIFLNHDRLDCRKENLRVVTKEDARRHHRVRSDSETGIKGVHYNEECDTWTAQTYRHGNMYGLGTFYSKEAAIAAYEADLRRENPDLHTAPPKVERIRPIAPVQPEEVAAEVAG